LIPAQTLICGNLQLPTQRHFKLELDQVALPEVQGSSPKDRVVRGTIVVAVIAPDEAQRSSDASSHLTTPIVVV
jgi:hypothetical protein